MEKFTQKEYEELCALLTDIHMHPGVIVYKSDINVAIEILNKLYDLFNSRRFENIEFILSVTPSLNDILFKIYATIKNIKEPSLGEDIFKALINNLSKYYNIIEASFKNIEKNSGDIKDSLIQLLQFLNLANNSKITVRDLIEKINQYNVQVDKDSNDLTIHKKEALTAIERERSDFLQFVEDSKKLLNKTQKNLLEEYNKLKEEQNIFKKEIYQEVNDIKTAVNREKLAAYFLNERKKLKGDIDLSLFICIVLAETSIYFFLDIFNDFWHTFTFLKMIIFLVCIFIIILLFAKLGNLVYCKIFNKNEKSNIEPFDEMKALLTPYWCWLGLTFIGMACIAKVAYSLYYINSTKIDHLDPYLLFANLPVFMILVWFTWFCSKQFSYTKQICDEYEYKYALSKSYLSYRDEAKNISLNDEDKGKYEAVIVSLLDSVIKNIATSPVKSVKPDCHTPFTEVFGSLKDVMKHTENKE